jgi:hypothetical protein
MKNIWGQNITRGTIVTGAGAHHGIVEKLWPRRRNVDVLVAAPQDGKGACRRYYLPVDMLRPVGQARRVPNCQAVYVTRAPGPPQRLWERAKTPKGTKYVASVDRIRKEQGKLIKQHRVEADPGRRRLMEERMVKLDSRLEYLLRRR